MCLGLPGRVVELSDDGDTAMVDVAGMTREINVGLLPEPVTVGDYILIHSGFALERMTAEEARDALDILGSLGISG
ncbi:MAG: HypC/HybG/HupF family hydrogenase formation chaperone [Nocardioides sp.]|nr:HypC/HybG/HupF family hydrogenase formation chaperone [Nocardioides sp.]